MAKRGREAKTKESKRVRVKANKDEVNDKTSDSDESNGQNEFNNDEDEVNESKGPNESKVNKIKENKTKESKTKESKTKESRTKDSDNDKGEKYWLLKAEPETRMVKGKDVRFSIDDLQRVGREHWDGVRNHEAKNNMRAMGLGDLAFFYHSNCKEPGIAGIMRISKQAFVDHTAFDSTHPYYDPKSDPDNPRWYMVEVEYVRHLKRLVSLAEIKQHAADLKNFPLINRSRLSVTSVLKPDWDYILDLETK